LDKSNKGQSKYNTKRRLGFYTTLIDSKPTFCSSMDSAQPNKSDSESRLDHQNARLASSLKKSILEEEVLGRLMDAGVESV
jgi:hypothetical protein